MNKRICRWLCLVLCLALCLALGACGTRAQQEAGPRTTEVKAGAVKAGSAALRYAAETLALPEGLRLSSLCALTRIGDSFFFACEEGENELLCAVDADGGNFRRLGAFTGWLRGICESERGTLLLLLIQIDAEEQTHVILVEAEREGTELSRSEIEPEDAPLFWQPNTLLCAEGLLYLPGDGVLYVMAEERPHEVLFSLPVSTAARMARLPDGRIVVGQSAVDGCILQAVDTENAAWGDSVLLDVKLDLCGAASADGLYLSDGNSVYHLNWESGELTKRFSWTGVGVFGGSFAEAGEGGYFCVSRTTGELCRLTESGEPLPEGEEGPVTLTLATVNPYTPLYLNEAVMRWNQAHPECQVEIRQYFSGDANAADPADVEKAIEDLSFDVNLGNLPDLYDLSRYAMAGEPVNAAMLSRKGYLEDLYPYIDASLGRDWFYGPLLDALEIGGGLYELAPKFNVLTTFGYGPDLGEDTEWTYDSLNRVVSESDYYKTLLNNDGHLSRYHFLYLLLCASGDKLVDWSAGSCHFDSEYFLHILEACAELPAQRDENFVDQSHYPHKWLQNSTSLLYYFMDFDEPEGPARMGLDGIGPEAAFVGFPELGNIFVPQVELAISAWSPHKAEAWDFLSWYVQDYVNADYGSFICSQASMDSRYAWWMDWLEVNSRDGYDILGNNPGLPAMLQRFLDAVDGCERVFRYDPAVMEIVAGEAERYFAGQLSAEQAAQAIQGRVKIYMAEQS